MLVGLQLQQSSTTLPWLSNPLDIIEVKTRKTTAKFPVMELFN
jgi:hypothetical protein